MTGDFSGSKKTEESAISSQSRQKAMGTIASDDNEADAVLEMILDANLEEEQRTEIEFGSGMAETGEGSSAQSCPPSDKPDVFSSDAVEVEAALQIDQNTDTVPLPPNYPPAIYPPITEFVEVRPVIENDLLIVDSEGVHGITIVEYTPGAGMEEDDDSDDDSEEMDDTSSLVSVGIDLRDDLEAALKGDFDFKGSFFYASVAPAAPNPCLNIEDLGYIGLPLSTRDAQAIVACSARAPFGRGEETVVDTDVRDTWEIEPARVKFDNPAWAQWIQTYVVKTVWEALGVAPASVPPKCELYKLLLYEAGSHFLPHQDTEKAEGMFATIIIVLPSPYTGGEVHLSHSSSQSIIDFAPNSLLSTSILAWYTDVTHEVKPLQSGYRLALSYNLIHAVPGVPRPTLPDMNTATSHLHHVLHKWRKSAYQQEEMDDNLVAYLLEHEYSEANLRTGAGMLKGADAHLINILRVATEDLGYMVCLANLDYHVTGSAEDDYGYRGYYGKRSRYNYDCGETPTMGEVHTEEFTLKNLVDLEGNSLLGPKSLGLSQWNLIPKDPFEDESPDDTDYEGYMGNYAGSLEHWYHRTVLVLVHEDEAPAIFLSSGGVHYALQRLQKSTSDIPSFDDKKMADLVLNSLNATDKATATVMSDYALKWKDLDMWKTVVKKSGSLISTFGTDKLIRAWHVFTFDSVRQSFEDILFATPRMGNKIDFIQSLPPHAPPGEHETVQAWAEEQSVNAFSTFDSPRIEDIPVLIAVGRARGAVFIVNEILPQLAKNASIFSFAIEFVKALHQHMGTIPEQCMPPSQTTTDPSSNDSVLNLIKSLLNTAAAQWDSVVAQPNPAISHYPYIYNRQPPDPPVQTQKVQRIIEVVELCLLTNDMATCQKLFLSVLKIQGSAMQKFQTLYNALIPRLRDLMKAKSVDLASPPFSDFLQLLVGSYLRDVLGAQGRNNRTKVRKVGCGCADCAQVDLFILSTTRTTELFRLAQSRRVHLEKRLNAAPDILSFVTVRSGNPHGVQVTKRPEIVAAQQWESRVSQAKQFLLSIGNNDDISRLMGRRYADVMKALTGTQQFALTVGDAAKQPQAQSSAPPPMSLASLPRLTSASSSGNTFSIAGGTAGAKRKKPSTVNLGTIDLTGDSS